tara:strand:- start:366 stop:518 length:153 start_codon:yes stop_codon:yes gene_type:complete
MFDGLKSTEPLCTRCNKLASEYRGGTVFDKEGNPYCDACGWKLKEDERKD